MVGDAVGSCGVIINEAEVVRGGGKDFGDLAKLIKAMRNGSRPTGPVSIRWHRPRTLCVNDGAIWSESRGLVNAKDRGAVYIRLGI